jgi:hypothetical protein
MTSACEQGKLAFAASDDDGASVGWSEPAGRDSGSAGRSGGGLAARGAGSAAKRWAREGPDVEEQVR